MYACVYAFMQLTWVYIFKLATFCFERTKHTQIMIQCFLCAFEVKLTTLREMDFLHKRTNFLILKCVCYWIPGKCSAIHPTVVSYRRCESTNLSPLYILYIVKITSIYRACTIQVLLTICWKRYQNQNMLNNDKQTRSKSQMNTLKNALMCLVNCLWNYAMTNNMMCHLFACKAPTDLRHFILFISFSQLYSWTIKISEYFSFTWIRSCFWFSLWYSPCTKVQFNWYQCAHG